MLLSSAYCGDVALKMALIRAIEFGKTKTKVIVLANHERFGFISNWVTKWRECSKPVARGNKTKPKQVQITLDTQVKIAPSTSYCACASYLCLCASDNQPLIAFTGALLTNLPR